jgi:hypothetical protein
MTRLTCFEIGEKRVVRKACLQRQAAETRTVAETTTALKSRKDENSRQQQHTHLVDDWSEFRF